MKNKILTLALASTLALGSFAATAYSADDNKLSCVHDHTNLAVGDVIGDEKLDLIYRDCSRISYDFVIKENLGEGKFKKHMVELIPGGFSDSYVSITVMDYDGDGKNDILLKQDQYVTLFKNKGNLKFEKEELF